MFLTIERLCDRAGTLANHVRRYIRSVQRHGEKVVDRLEETGDLGRVSFGDPARDLRREMEILSGVARGPDERKEFLAFYYALQYIIMEIHSLDLLRYHLVHEERPRSHAYRQCFTYARKRFQELSSTYLGVLCELLLPETARDRFVLLGVGTMGDRDDIDVAAVDDLDASGRKELSRGLSRLAQVMLRTSCTLHFHMAEVLGSPVLSESLDAYSALAGRRPYNPVVISQMIHARPLAGSDGLARRFARRVASRFHYHPAQTNEDHEGFLRGMLGEIHEFLQRPVAIDHISPKEDGLRPIKGYLSLCRSVHHVPGDDWDQILDYLRYRGPRYEREYAVLDEALTFLETVRYLHQILVVEDEEIATGDETPSGNLTLLAERMGFSRRGRLGAATPFLMRYYDLVDELRHALHVLMTPLTDHLRQVSALSLVFRSREFETGGGSRNLPVRHVAKARPFFGTRFWNDLLEEFSRKGSGVADRYVRDLARLSPGRRKVVLRGLVEWGATDVASFLRFLVAIQDRARVDEELSLLGDLVDLFLGRCEEEAGIAEKLAASFHLWPSEIQRFLTTLDGDRLARFAELARGKTGQQLREAGEHLSHLAGVHQACGDRYLDSLRAVVQLHPHTLRVLRHPSELRALADTFYGQAERFSDLFSRREWLEAYYHLETVRLGLDFMDGRPCHQLSHEYRLGMHILLRSLYFLCRKELYDLYHMEWSKRHSVGVYLEAGCLAFHPFDPLLRMIVLLFQEDDEMERFFREVVSSFQHELEGLRISVIPCPVDGEPDLVPRRLAAQRELLERRAEETGDSLKRLLPLKFNRIVGTRGHLRRFSAEVIEPLVRPVRGQLGTLLLDRLSERRSALAAWSEDEPVDPHEMPGGTRDLETFYLSRCALSGEPSLCDTQPACGIGDATAGPELVELGRSMAVFQSLAVARRLLRSEPDAGGIDAAFTRRHAAVLERRPEISREMIEAPTRHLHRLGRHNLDLVEALIERSMTNA